MLQGTEALPDVIISSKRQSGKADSERYFPENPFFKSRRTPGFRPPERVAGSGCIKVPDVSDTIKNKTTWSSLMPEEQREFF